MSTQKFGCHWDSGLVGIIYVTKEQVRREWNVKRISPKLHKQIVAILESQVKIYDDYLTGNVWMFFVETPDGDWVDSTGGYYGDWDGKWGALEEGRDSIDYHNREAVKEHVARLKQWIKSKVPFQYRKPCPLFASGEGAII